jgi:hypothetical protein
VKKYCTPMVEFSEIKSLDILTISAEDENAEFDNWEEAPDDWFN